MDKAGKDAVRIGFDRTIKLAFHGAQVSSDAGLFSYRDLDDAAGLTDSAGMKLVDLRTGGNIQRSMASLLRQSIYSRLAGHEDVNDAQRLSVDPVMRQEVATAPRRFRVFRVFFIRAQHGSLTGHRVLQHNPPAPLPDQPGAGVAPGRVLNPHSPAFNFCV